MKTRINRNEPPKVFRPVEITFTFETQVELDTMGQLFNVGAIADAIRELSGIDRTYKVFKDAGANIENARKTFLPFLKGHFNE